MTPAGLPSSGFVGDPSMSADGRYVVFMSTATDLVSWATTPMVRVCLRDLTLGTTWRIADTNNPDTNNADTNTAATNGIDSDVRISRNGRRVAYEDPTDGSSGLWLST